MIRIFNFILTALFFIAIFSCETHEKITIPENLITEPEMVDILTDICKVEARFQRRLTISGFNHEELASHNYTIVFNEYQVTLNQFKESYEYYENDPKKMQELFDQVIIKLTKEEAELKKVEGANK